MEFPRKDDVISGYYNGEIDKMDLARLHIKSMLYKIRRHKKITYRFSRKLEIDNMKIIVQELEDAGWTVELLGELGPDPRMDIS